MTTAIGRDAFLQRLSVLSFAAVAGCAGGAVPTVNEASSRSVSDPDCSNPYLATRKGPRPDCVTGSGPGSISSLSPAQVAALTAANIEGLTGDQIAEFSDLQLHYITNAQAFHGAQASAILARVAAVGTVAPIGGCTPGIPTTQCVTPPTYTPPNPGSNFWSWWGGIIGGVVGGAAGVTVTGPGAIVVGAVGGAAGSTLGSIIFEPTDAYYNFYNTNTQEWNSVDLGPASNFESTTENGNTGQSSLDTDGYQVQGTFNASSDTVTVTVIAN